MNTKNTITITITALITYAVLTLSLHYVGYTVHSNGEDTFTLYLCHHSEITVVENMTCPLRFLLERDMCGTDEANWITNLNCK